ncbi:MAG TPA: hypothetical protein VLO07_00655 [Thermoanaerobaculia bacterium]|nr:hypothetical protein [Thermoanaerobaculia bacterium]
MQTTEPRDDAILRRRDVNIGAVLRFGFWLVVCAILVHLAVWGFFRLLEAQQNRAEKPISPMVAASLKRTPPEPRLEPDPRALRLKMLAEEDAVLTTYGWVDKKAGTVRIPIDRAMELLAERGLPPSKPMPAAPAAAASAPERKQ